MTTRNAMDRFPRYKPCPLPAVLRIVGIACLVAGLGGCQGARESAAENMLQAATGHEIAVDRSGNTTTLRAEDGSEARISTGNNVQLPATFPQDVYLPGEYTLSSVTEMKPVTMVQLSSASSVDALSAETDKRMQAMGWKQVMAMHQASGSAVLAYEKEQRHASFTLSQSAAGGHTFVGVQLQNEG